MIGDLLGWVGWLMALPAIVLLSAVVLILLIGAVRDFFAPAAPRRFPRC